MITNVIYITRNENKSYNAFYNSERSQMKMLLEQNIERKVGVLKYWIFSLRPSW